MSPDYRRACLAAGLRAGIFLSIVCYCIFLFHERSSHLFIGFDGGYVLDLAKRELSLKLPLTALTGDFYSGLGDIVYPTSFALFPSFQALRMIVDLDWGKAVCFGFVLAELALATYFFARAIEFGHILSMASAMVVGILLFPFANIGFIFSIVPMVPQSATTIAVALGMACAFIRFGRCRLSRDWPWGALFLLLLLWCLFATITMLVIAVGFLMLTALAALAAATRGERLQKIGLLLVTAVVFFCFGPVLFLMGIVFNSVPTFFARELEDNVSSLGAVSILFHVASYGYSGPVLVVVAAIGVAWSAWDGKRIQRTFAIMLIVFFLLLVFLAAIMMGSAWRGPAPLYLEMFFIPLYVMFALSVLPRLVALLAANIRIPKLPTILPEVAVVLAAIGFVTVLARTSPVHSYGWTYPPRHTPITQILASEVAMSPGTRFRGRVATLTGRAIEGKPVSWLDLHGQDGSRLAETGNDHRITGLNYFRIPVVFPYGPTISPAFYALTSRLLAEPGDVPMRNVVVLRRIEPRTLTMLGVRFVITDAPAELVADRRSQIEVGEGALYLYELSEANIGQYSPTVVEVLSTASAILARMKEKDFDARMHVILDRAIDTASLTPARDSSLLFEGSSMRYRATSDGRSMAVLPIEFSRCLVVKSLSGPPVRIVRANLALTGILFSKDIDVRVSIRIGPFSNSGCRLADRREMIELGLQDLPESPTIDQ